MSARHEKSIKGADALLQPLSWYVPYDLVARFNRCQDRDVLRRVARRISRNPVISARSLFPDRRSGYVTLTKLLGNYADNLVNMLCCRQQGDRPGVLRCQRACDEIINAMPRWRR